MKDLKETQEQKTLKWIVDHGSINFLTAERELGIHRLADRIFKLRAKGYKIESKLVKVRASDGTFTHIAEYSLVEEEEDGRKSEILLDQAQV